MICGTSAALGESVIREPAAVTVRMSGAEMVVDAEVEEEMAPGNVEIDSDGVTLPVVVEAITVAGDAGVGLAPAPAGSVLLTMKYQSPRAANNPVCIDDAGRNRRPDCLAGS